jgi:hypothetical protein
VKVADEMVEEGDGLLELARVLCCWDEIYWC